MINDEISAQQIRLIGETGEQLGIVSLAEAKTIAAQHSLDLVQMAEGDPAVCKLQDFGKEVFERKKRDKESRKKQKRTQVKEIKFRPGTEEGDYQVKLRNLTRFLEDGDKTKVTLRYRGREMAHQEIGMELLKRVEKDLEEYGSVEQFPVMEGRQLVMVLAPSKKGKKGYTAPSTKDDEAPG